MKKYLLLLFVLITFCFTATSQPWMALIPENKRSIASFQEIQQAFNEYWESKKIVKGKGWKQFKRWEDFYKPRVYPNGEFQPLATWNEFRTKSTDLSKSLSGTWTPLGPTNTPNDLYGQKSGSGRINCIAFHPTNSNIFYVGCPSGGIWKTSDGGTSWQTTTDQLSSIGISDIAIHPTDPNILFVASGDGDGADTYAIGVIKSIDGGATWNTTGLNLDVSQNYTCRRIIINPTDPNILILATNQGLYRSTNGGNSWFIVASGSFKDAEFKPGNPTIVYATSYGWNGSSFWKSTNSGQNFSEVSISSWVTGDVFRAEIGVTPANPELVYVVASNFSDDGLYGVFKSSNSGSTFSQVFSGFSLNLLGWSSNGSDSGGQGWYDLTISVSPTNQNTVFVGGVNLWRSTNGGTSWTIKGHWYGDGAAYVHADHHFSAYNPLNNQLFSGNDGGIYYSTDNGNNWTDLSDGLQILQIYKIGTSASNSAIVLAGSQDNGTMKKSGTTWTNILGGDGMECLVDRTNPSIMYGTLYYGNLFRSTDSGNNFNDITPPGVEGAWVTPLAFHPTSNSTLYAAYSDVYKTTNSGQNWTAISSNLTGGEKLNAIAISASNPLYIYTSSSESIYKTTNGGTSWADISSGLPSLFINSICIHPTDPLKIWVSLSGFQAGQKVFKSVNGGSSWTNISGSLPNVPANCLVYENNSPDGIYAGTDIGVYYLNSNLTDWLDFSSGLPNVIVNDLEIHYGTSKLRAGTFGRGLWESDLCTISSTPPQALFSANPTTCIPGSNIQFQDNSTGSPTSWNWSFPGGSPSSSTIQNPVIQYNTAGNYNVSLTVSNINGSNTLTQTSYIHVQSGLADLTILEQIINPIQILPDSGFSISATIKNIGNYASVSCNLKVYLSADPTISVNDTIVWQEIISNQTPNNQILVSHPPIQINNRFGIYYILSSIDSDNQVVESNELNNISTQQIEFIYPDLKVQYPAITPFSNVLPGDTVSISCEIFNQGTSTSDSCRFTIYYSMDTNFDSSDIQLINIALGEINPQNNLPILENVEIPAVNQFGTHYLILFVDDLLEIHESNETNNSIIKFINIIQPFPELGFTAINLDTTTTFSGGNISFTLIVANGGNLESSETTLKIILSDDQIYQTATDVFLDFISIPGLAENHSFTITSIINLPQNIQPGFKNLGFIIDPFQTITESDETNNIFFREISIVSNLPDLVIINPNVDTENIAQGMILNVKCQVRNIGFNVAQESDLVFYMSSFPQFDEQAVPKAYNQVYSLVSSGESWEINSFQIPYTAANGTYYIWFVSDPANLIQELNKENNYKKVEINVSPLTSENMANIILINPYPNPVSENLYTNLNLTSTGVLQIQNILGQTIQQLELSAGIQELTVSTRNYPSGVYYMKVICLEGEESSIFIKE